MEPKTERPLVHCLIGRKIDAPDGRVGRIRRVKLSDALIALESGLWFVVGPDPREWEALMAWEQAQVPFNNPRVSDAN